MGRMAAVTHKIDTGDHPPVNQQPYVYQQPYAFQSETGKLAFESIRKRSSSAVEEKSSLSCSNRKQNALLLDESAKLYFRRSL